MEQNNCSKLHVCRHFLKGTCKFPQCIMSHNLLDDHSMRVLEMGGIDGKTASNFQAIYDFKHVEFNKEQKKGYGKLQETVVLDFEFDRGRNCSCLTSQLNPTILLGLSVHNYRPRNEYWKRPVTPTIKEVKTTLETVQCTMDVPPSEGKYLANSTNHCLVESVLYFSSSNIYTFFPFLLLHACKNGVSHGVIMWEGELHFYCLKYCIQNSN